MKRKNILKFVSLLGIGSFVMLAAASCSQAATRTPSSNSSSSNTNSMPAMNNTPSSGASMNSADPELAAARMALSTSVGTKEQNTNMYVDYAKIQKALTDAYSAAQAVLDNSGATTQNLKDAKSTLDAAINTAASSKQTFDTQNPELVKAYGELKTTLGGEAATLAPLAEEQFAGIKMHLSGLYGAGKVFTNKTLYPLEGDKPETSAVTDANTKIAYAIKEETLKPQKENATQLHGSFIKQVVVKDKITGTTNTMAQPGNYSFVGYSVDVNGTTNGSTNTMPNWNFAQRTVFSLLENPVMNMNTGGQEGMAKPLTDVSWIYSLVGTDGMGKYTLEFTYYGPSTGYLYFPYKLVKADDNNKLGLQYNLNDGENQTQITFGDGSDMNGKTPTVGDINVAVVTLSNLKFGSNKIEFSVPNEKVNPMIGNMYLTSSPDNLDKVYNDIFGNSVETKENKTVVSIDPLSGYSLAADWATLIYEYGSNELQLDNMSTNNKKYYLVGWVGGTSKRGVTNRDDQTNKPDIQNVHDYPEHHNNQTDRTYTFYVNAHEAGDYYIKGIVTQGDRGINFKTGTEGNNSVTINFNTSGSNLMTFDTSKADSTVDNMKMTLKLEKGLNKVIVSGVMNKGSGNAPNSGYYEFILKSEETSTES